MSWGLCGVPLRPALEHKFATSLPAASSKGCTSMLSVSGGLLHLSHMMDDWQPEMSRMHDNSCGINPAVILTNRLKAVLSRHE